jgi:hypothetical protein
MASWCFSHWTDFRLIELFAVLARRCGKVRKMNTIQSGSKEVGWSKSQGLSARIALRVY